MTLDSSTGYYVIEVSDSLANGAVIFSDGTNSASKRYPADAKPGLNLNGATKIFKANHTFEDYNTPVPTQSTTAQPTTAKLQQQSLQQHSLQHLLLKAYLSVIQIRTVKLQSAM